MTPADLDGCPHVESLDDGDVEVGLQAQEVDEGGQEHDADQHEAVVAELLHGHQVGRLHLVRRNECHRWEQFKLRKELLRLKYLITIGRHHLALMGSRVFFTYRTDRD